MQNVNAWNGNLLASMFAIYVFQSIYRDKKLKKKKNDKNEWINEKEF